MNILSAVQAVVGGIVIFFAAGWIVMSRYFHERGITKIAYSVAISITMSLLISFALGFLGVFSILTFLIAYVFICLVLLVLSWVMQ